MPGAGVSYHSLLERIQAARWGGYKVHEFFDLDHKWMETIIAAYRTEKKIEAVLQNEQNKKMKSKSRKGSSGTPSKGKGGRS